jgi:hypothetical protein
MGECSMTEDTKAIVGSRTRKIASIEDIDEATDVVLATGEWSPPTTQREAARSQMLWMVGQASRAAKSGLVDDARWWRDRAVSALWNMN